MKENTEKPFSHELEGWLKSSQPKTLLSLGKLSGEKSFAITILLLMLLPALPLPTGGLSHVFEAITILLAIEMVFGLKSIWLPQRWNNLVLSPKLTKEALPFISRRLRWLEKFSRRRFSEVVQKKVFGQFAGMIICALALASMLAPPFSGLDTLPALGVVAIVLSLILEDIVLFVVGCVIGAFGVLVIFTLGSTIFKLLGL